MKAMIFAAGLGTRLRPLTDTMPKALVTIQGKSLLEITIRKLIDSGFNEIIINIHHFGDQVLDFLERNHNFNIRIEVSDEREFLLDTGGGLLKASWFFDDGKPFLVHNVDVLSGINLMDLYNCHITRKPLATLAVKTRVSSRYLIFDDNQCLCAWKNIKTGEMVSAREIFSPVSELAFSGIQVISPGIFGLIEQKGAFPLVRTYLFLAAKNDITCFRHDNDYFIDVGRINNLEEAQKLILF